jgi:hypothetical protein
MTGSSSLPNKRNQIATNECYELDLDTAIHRVWPPILPESDSRVRIAIFRNNFPSRAADGEIHPAEIFPPQDIF